MRVVICRATPANPDPRVEKIARSLVEAGWAVSVLAWDMDGSLPLEERGDGYIRRRLRVKARFGRGLINLVHQLRWQWALMWWLLKRRRDYDVIHTCDFDTVLPAVLMRRLFAKTVIYDIFDFYADMLRATPGWVVNLLRVLDLRVIGQVDGIILADESRLRQIAGAKPLRCALVYNCLEDNPAWGQTAQPALEKLRISYVGNLQIERGLQELLEVMARRPDFELDLAGFGGDELLILEQAGRLDNVRWHGRVDYGRAMQLNQQAGVLIATYDPKIPNHRYSSPNKVFEAMALGKPVIVASGTNMDGLIEREGCGLVVPYGSAAALEEALDRLQSEAGLAERLGGNARRAFERVYNWREMESRLLALYQEAAQ
jgi:glycosyltransferase involved in cell wall biosynthesis